MSHALRYHWSWCQTLFNIATASSCRKVAFLNCSRNFPASHHILQLLWSIYHVSLYQTLCFHLQKIRLRGSLRPDFSISVWSVCTHYLCLFQSANLRGSYLGSIFIFLLAFLIKIRLRSYVTWFMRLIDRKITHIELLSSVKL